jgi:hypothetical protein
MTNLQRSKKKLDPSDFYKLTELIIECPWIQSEAHSLADLWNLCESPKEEELIIDLIKRFTCLNDVLLKKQCEKVRKFIIEDWELKSDYSFIIAVSDDLEADGSQYFLNLLKGHFAAIPNWKERNFKNTIGAIHEIQDSSTIILLDDFIGTGKTIIRKVKWVQKTLLEAGKRKMKIKIVAIAGMEFSKYNLDELNLDYYAPIWLKKGISDHYEGIELYDAIKSMETLESKLKSKYNNKNLRDFVFGYGRSESLYSINTNSVPNNVFPIFWWPVLSDGLHRKTLFNRL